MDALESALSAPSAELTEGQQKEISNQKEADEKEAAALLGIDQEQLSKSDRMSRIAKKVQLENMEKEKEETVRRELDKANRDENAVRFVTQYHPCSFCGGVKRKVILKNGEDDRDRVKIGLELEMPSRDGNAEPLIICNKCQHKVYATILGQALYYGTEIEHLTGLTSKGFIPKRRPFLKG